MMTAAKSFPDWCSSLLRQYAPICSHCSSRHHCLGIGCCAMDPSPSPCQTEEATPPSGCNMCPKRPWPPACQHRELLACEILVSSLYWQADYHGLLGHRGNRDGEVASYLTKWKTSCVTADSPTAVTCRVCS